MEPHHTEHLGTSGRPHVCPQPRPQRPLHAVNPAHHSTHRARMHGITVAATRLHARPGWPDGEYTCHRERPRCCSPLEPPLWLEVRCTVQSLLLSYTQANRVRRGRGEIALQAAESPPTLLPAHLALTLAIIPSTRASTSHLEADRRFGGALTALSQQQHHLRSRELDSRHVSAQCGGSQGRPSLEEQRTYSGCI